MTQSSQEAPERQTIRNAMERLLADAPLHSDGKLTVKSLAEEAQVKRWLLTHRHTDLQDEFRRRVADRDRVPNAAEALRQENAALNDRIAELAGELKQERETVKRLERVVHVLGLQLDQERRTNSTGSNVHPLRQN
jgi:ribosomal protein RSM22 (predicted rRNA methylase)